MGKSLPNPIAVAPSYSIRNMACATAERGWVGVAAVVGLGVDEKIKKDKRHKP